MASTIEPNSVSRAGDPDGADQGHLVEYEHFIAAQIRKTRGQVKGVEIAGAVLRLLVGALVYLLAVALVDHWILSEGLGLWGRLGALAFFAVGVGAYLTLLVAPLIARRVNPIYAAHTIEQHQPTLKNSLVNFLLLRGSRRELAPAVYQAIEQRAASDLSHVPVDTVVDRTRLVRWSYALLVVVAVFALYFVLSPKDPLRSLARMLAPWADLRPPTRVTIKEVQPGSTRAFHGDRLTVSGIVRGTRSGEPVTLFYSTDDGQTVNRAIAMSVPEGGYRHEATLPASTNGLQQGVSYYLVAGDFATEQYHVEVLTAPSILVEAVDYEYPSYASIANGRVERIGDIAALVGTKVTIHGRANRPIKSAHLDLNCDGKYDRTMDVQGQATSVSFELKLGPDGKAEYGSYQLIFVSEENRENPQPIRHTIAVAPDQPPTVELVLPEKADLDVPQNGAVSVALRAADPDFALRDVTLHARRGKDTLLNERLLAKSPWRGEYRGAYVIDLTKLAPQQQGRPAIAVGDVIEYWAEARDVKQPVAGRAETVHYQLHVTSPADEQKREEQLAEAQQEKQSFEKPPGDSGKGAGQEEFQLASREPDQEAQQQPDKNGAEEPQKRVDPEKDPAAAMKEVLKLQEEKGAEKPQDDDGSSQGDKGEDPSGQEETQSGAEPSKSQGEQQKGEPGDNSGSPQGGQSGSEPSDNSNQSNGTGSEQKGGGQSQANSPPQGGAAEDSSSKGNPNSGDNNNGGKSGGDAGDEGTKPGEVSSGGKPSGKPGELQPEKRVRGENEGPGQGRQERRPDEAPGADNNPAEKSGPVPGEQGASGTEAPSKETDPASGDAKPGESQEDAPPSETKPNKPGERSGQGAQSGQSGDADKPKSPPSDANENENAQGGEPEDPKGESGAGQAQGNEQGSPSPQEKNTPKEKNQQSPDSKNKESSEASSPTTSPRESDSQGGEEGDRSGGGQEGGGQKANQQGTGGAGQNTAADEGGGAAEGSGGGPTSDQPGSKQPGGQGQGKSQGGQGGSGGEQGQGAKTQASGGSSAGGRPGQGGQGAKPGAGEGGQGAGGQGGGGQNHDDSALSQGNSNTEPGGDEVDLEAARKATDLVLERLEDQLKKNDLDEELLERLGWTRQDVENFVRRWQELRDKAGDPTAPDGAKHFDDALRQLGLHGSGTVLDGNEHKPTEQKQLRESFRSTPPADYAEQYRAYTQGLSRGRPSPPQQK